ncbi:MAG: hypothetical protein MSH10_08830 [Pygmaiobacter massiliensis]|nr:hypothetical protein [Pygmaiobacter massiliensis]
MLTSEDDSAQMETVEMDGLTFRYDAKFSCEKGNIVFEEGKSYLSYMESSSGGSDSQEESDDGPLYHEFILDMLGITPEQEPAEMQIDGKRALRSKSQNDMDGVVVHYDLVTFEAGQNLYTFLYTWQEGAADYEMDFLNLLNSISFK